jgi:hypothetical protein
MKHHVARRLHCASALEARPQTETWWRVLMKEGPPCLSDEIVTNMAGLCAGDKTLEVHGVFDR